MSKKVCICDFGKNQEIINIIGIVLALIQLGISTGNFREAYYMPKTSKNVWYKIVITISVIMVINGLTSLTLNSMSIASEKQGTDNLKYMYCKGETIKRSEHKKCYEKYVQIGANISTLIVALFLFISIMIFSLHGWRSGLIPFDKNNKNLYYLSFAVMITCAYAIYGTQSLL